MPYDMRGVLDSLGIEWRDRGKNVGRGRIVINCPFCPDDPSFHCTIHADKGIFYCFRNTDHKGGPHRLLRRLLGTYDGVEALLDEFGTQEPSEPRERPVKPILRWARFLPAAGNDAYCDYLAERGFDDPERVARRFDLRYAEDGKWAQRLLLPLRDVSNPVASFSGRAIRKQLEPRYLAFHNDAMPACVAGVLHTPTLIVVEGPLDALKINAAFAHPDIGAVALTGLAVPPQRAMTIRRASPKRLLVCLDREATPLNRILVEKELRFACPQAIVEPLALPGDYKDAGEMKEEAVRTWLSPLLEKPDDTILGRPL